MGAAFGPAEAPAAIYPNGIPAWLDGAFLLANGVEIQPGVPVETTGNRIPDTPEHTLSLAASYTWDVFGGTLTPRWDYYWQNESFLTIYNRPSHEIDSWDRHDASLNYESGDGAGPSGHGFVTLRTIHTSPVACAHSSIRISR